jgi:hypothetical protein
MCAPVIDVRAVANDLCRNPDGTWSSGAAAAAWDQVQIATVRDPLKALAVVALVVHHVAPAAAAKIAAKVLRPIIEFADASIVLRLTEYREHDDRMREAIEAADRYLQKEHLLQSLLRSGRLPCCSTSSASSLPLPNAYGDKQRLGDVFPTPAPLDIASDADELFDAFDVLVSNDPEAAWRVAAEVAARAVTDRDRLIVAQSLSRLLTLNERVIAADVIAQMCASQPLREVMAHCRYAISERLLDEMLCAGSDKESAASAVP